MPAKNTYILGLNFAYHELSACLIKEGQLIAAVEEERFSRIKHGKEAKVDNPNTMPTKAINYCLEMGGINLSDVDYFALGFNPDGRLKNIGVDEHYEQGNWGSEDGEELFHSKLLEVPRLLSEMVGADISSKVRWVPHHVSHAASAFFVSPFKQAAILSVDGIGEFSSTWFGVGKGHTIENIKEINYPHSLGFVWEKLSKFLGFSEYDAGKVMGLSAYGDSQIFYPKFRELITIKPDGEFEVDNSIFQFRLNDFTALEQHLGVNKIDIPAARTKEHENIAATLQKITDELIIHFAKFLSEITSQKNLCLAGGVALNSVANQKIMQSKLFESIYIQPAAHDAGTALGAAFYVWNHLLSNERSFVMEHVYWGPEYTNQEIETALQEAGAKFERLGNIAEATAKLLADGNIVGWFQGRMEWGPRALGNRTLLADPRNAVIKTILNERIKKREPFRPFAPSVIKEEAYKWFSISTSCQSISTEFMEINFDVLPDKKKLIPAVTHIDGTSRIQIVRKETNPKYHALISAFGRITGVPVVLNTSFNDNEPIVCSPQDAIKTFQRTKMDYLAIGDFLVKKE